MFVEQEQHDGDNAGQRGFAQCEGRKQGDEKDQHDEMEGARDPHRGADAEVARDGVQSGIAIEVEVLAGIEDVETGDPEGDGGGEQKDARVKRAANRDPGGGRCDAQSETQDEMGETGEALGIGIEQ